MSNPILRRTHPVADRPPVHRKGTLPGTQVHGSLATVSSVLEDGSSVVLGLYRGSDDSAEAHAAYGSAIARTAAADHEPQQIAAWAGAEDSGRASGRRRNGYRR